MNSVPKFTFTLLVEGMLFLNSGCSNPFAQGGKMASIVDATHHPGADLSGIPDSSHCSVSATGNITADGTTTATVQITILDSYSAPVPGVVPTFSATDSGGTNRYNACLPTNASGVAICTFTSTRAESKTISVISPVSLTGGDINFVAGPLAKITFSRQPNGGVAGLTWSAQPLLTLSDAFGNTVESGTDSNDTVTLSLSAGSGALSGTASLSATGGIVDYSTANLSINLIGSKTITASATSSTGQTVTATSAAFTILPGIGDINNSTLSANPLSLFADGTTTSTVTLVLKDAYSNVIPGKTVSLSSSRSGTDTISPASLVTDSSGTAVFYVSSSTAGAPVMTATDTSDGITVSQTVTLTFISYIASASESTVSTKPVSVANDGTTTATVTAVIRNSSGTVLPGKTVSFASSRGATDTLSSSTAVTDTSGKADITVTSTTAGNSAISVSVGADSVTLNQTGTVLYLSQNPLTDWQARLATGSMPGTNSSTTEIEDLEAESSNYGTLNHFSYNNTTSGWAGDGTTTITSGATGPYRLLFDGVGSFVNFGTGINTNSDFSIETWIRSAASAGSTGRGKVILSNGDATPAGMTLRQAWDGSGKVSLYLGSKSYVEEVLADNPIAYWRLGETGTATTALDSSGNGTTGTYTGGYTLGQTHNWGDSDKAVLLDGSSGYVQTNYTQSSVTAYTIEAWIKTTDAGSEKVIFHNRGNSSTSGKSLTLGIGKTGGGHGSAGNVGWELDSDTIDIGISSTATVNDGNWHYIVGTWSASSGTAVAASQFTIYIDGAAASTTSGATGAATSPLSGLDTAQIGHHKAWNTYFSGVVDDLAVYTSVLSSTRIQAHYAARLRTACLSSQALTDGAWTFLTGIFSSSGPTLELYVNGSLDCSITNSGAAFTGSANPLSAGAQVTAPNSAGSGTYWQGAIGDIRTYSSALSGTNVQTNYNATSARFP